MQIKLKSKRTGGAWLLILVLVIGIAALAVVVAEAILKRAQEIERQREQALTNAVDEAAFVYRPRPDHELVIVSPPDTPVPTNPDLDYEFASPPDYPGTVTNTTPRQIKDPWYDESGF